MIQAAKALGEVVRVSAACRALGVPRRSVYRPRRPDGKPTAARAIDSQGLACTILMHSVAVPQPSANQRTEGYLGCKA